MSPFSKHISNDRRSLQGVILLLISLGVFFVGSLVLYAVYVLLRISPEAGRIIPFYLPRVFILTTIILIAISILLHMSVGAVRQERQTDFARYLVIALLLSLAFFITQGVSLYWMIDQLLQPHETIVNLYGLTMVLVIIHALHVIGGVAGIVFVIFGITKQAYDHERHFPVRFCAIYWHFLDLVWIAMFFCFGLAAYLSRTHLT